MKYLALTDAYTDVDTCRQVIRQGETLPERYEPQTGTWVEDVELLCIYAGEIETTPITKEQAERIIGRLKQ